MLNKTLAILAAIAAALAALFGLRSQKHQAEAERDRQRAETAEAASATHQRIAEGRTELEKLHREQQADIEQRLDQGKRDHLEKRW
jgi:uncharacterized membrane protein